MQTKAPMQIQIVVSPTTLQRFQISKKETCENIVRSFSEALEKYLGFKEGRSLYALYDKVLAISCDEMISGLSSAYSQLCMAARTYGYQPKISAPISLFAELLHLDDFDVSIVSEVWIVHSASDESGKLEEIWKSLNGRGVSIVLVARPESVLNFAFLDRPEVSASSFRIVSPGACSNHWPLDFCIDKFGTFSRVVTCPYSGALINSVDELLRGSSGILLQAVGGNQ